MQQTRGHLSPSNPVTSDRTGGGHSALSQLSPQLDQMLLIPSFEQPNLFCGQVCSSTHASEDPREIPDTKYSCCEPHSRAHLAATGRLHALLPGGSPPRAAPARVGHAGPQGTGPAQHTHPTTCCLPQVPSLPPRTEMLQEQEELRKL